MSPKKHHDNLTREERQALSSLRAGTDIVIKKADKGSATVVMPREDYISKVICHLGDRERYRKLNEDPTIIFLQEIETYLSEMVSRHSINEETDRSLIPDEARVSRFYVLPKIHKPGSPGRPIVSSCWAPTEGISCFVDFHLSLLVKSLPSYIKDTTDF